MLTFFTDPYPDELIYSAIARYHFYTGNVDFKDTLEELFGSRNVIACVEIGSNFAYLVDQLGSQYSIESILSNHTIYPYYASFLSKTRQQNILQDVQKDGKALFARLGFNAGSICKKEGLYYCSKCAIEDDMNYGEPYIHREHNLQGINYCVHHSVRLKKYPIDLNTRSRIEYIRFELKKMDLSESISKESDDYILKDIEICLAKMAYELLKLPLGSLSREKFNLIYKNLLRNMGLTKKNFRVKQSELYNEFIKKLPGEILTYYESDLDDGYEYNWLRVITRDLKRHVHPLRHLLLIYFFGFDIQNILFKEDYRNPFGEGPWPCLNIAATHYLKDTVEKINISRVSATGNLLGTFECECGFIYTRKGPDKGKENRYKKDFIKEFGSVWISKVKQLSNEGLSINKISKQLNVDWKTIDRYLNEDISSPKNLYTRFVYQDYIEEYKRNILNGIAENPGISRTQLRLIYQKEYAYLYKYEKNWLMDNLPKKQKVFIKDKRVNWIERDKQYLNLIQNEYEYLINLENPVRITKSLIGKRLGINANLEKNSKKLPETEAYLKLIIESTQEFQIRKCIKVIDKLFLEGKAITKGKIRGNVKMRDKHYNLYRLN